MSFAAFANWEYKSYFEKSFVVVFFLAESARRMREYRKKLRKTFCIHLGRIPTEVSVGCAWVCVSVYVSVEVKHSRVSTFIFCVFLVSHLFAYRTMRWGAVRAWSGTNTQTTNKFKNNRSPRINCPCKSTQRLPVKFYTSYRVKANRFVDKIKSIMLSNECTMWLASAAHFLFIDTIWRPFTHRWAFYCDLMEFTICVSCVTGYWIVFTTFTRWTVEGLKLNRILTSNGELKERGAEGSSQIGNGISKLTN